MGWGGSAGDDDRPRQPGLRRTDTRMSKASPSQLSAAEVAEYLRQNPAFFVEHDDLLADLLIPHQSGQAGQQVRSEEHTSELQSRPHLVCRLLLEKKKQSHHCSSTISLHTLPCLLPSFLL